MERNTKIQSLWIGGDLSKLEQLSMKSFIENGHEYILYVYGEVGGIPDGVIVEDANNIISSDKIFKYPERDSYAGFANLFRYKLLYDKGGIWVDTDVICLKPFRFETEHLVASEKKRTDNEAKTDEKPFKVTNCILKAPVNSNIMEYCYQVSKKKNPNKLTWGETGPDLVDKAFLKFGKKDCIAHPDDFCPVNWWEWQHYINPPVLLHLIDKIIPFKINSIHSFGGSIRRQIELKQKVNSCDPYAYHFWNEMWRRNDVDKNGSFSQNSIYEKLKKKYGIT